MDCLFVQLPSFVWVSIYNIRTPYMEDELKSADSYLHPDYFKIPNSYA